MIASEDGVAYAKSRETGIPESENIPGDKWLS
jgi:hypothetical protein